MPNITIDNTEYDLAALSEQAKNQLQMLQACEQELQRLQVQVAIAQTARVAYARALKEALPQAPLDVALKLPGFNA
jgi:hypothetical protein